LKRAYSTPAVLAFIALTWMRAAPAAAGHDPADKPADKPTTAACGVEDLLAGRAPTASVQARGSLAFITDGAVAPEGAQWDAPVVVTLDSGAAFVTYDLGQPRPISALTLQADANDTYKILGSSDEAPASFKLLVEIQNVVDRAGHGLRTRAVEIPSTIVRYLRVGEANGDGFYSISELAAYCQKPSPFPPAMRIVEAPPAQVGDAPPSGPGPRPKHDGGSVFILAAAAAALAWLAYRTVRR
jgi:hypothetical protein